MGRVTIGANARTRSRLGGSGTSGGGGDPYLDAVLADSPAALWGMQETSGNLVDLTGNGHTATLVGSVTYGASGPGSTGRKAISFPGSGANGFSVADDNVWSSASFTTAGWVWLASTGNRAFWVKVAGVNYEWQMVSTATQWFARVNNNTNTGYLDAVYTTTPTTGAWVHVAHVMDAATTTARLVIDGVTVATDSTPTGTRMGNLAGAVTIGYDAGAARPHDGRLAYLAFFPTALSNARLAAHYAAMT